MPKKETVVPYMNYKGIEIYQVPLGEGLFEFDSHWYFSLIPRPTETQDVFAVDELSTWKPFYYKDADVESKVRLAIREAIDIDELPF